MEALKQTTLEIFIPRAPGNMSVASVQLMKRLVHLGFSGEFDGLRRLQRTPTTHPQRC